MGHLVKGTHEPSFSGLRDLLSKHISEGDEVGASIVVNIDGQNVVDIWGGYFDESGTRSWERDTIVNVFSTTKTITSLAALILIDRGIISPYEKVATHWPEFAANGKQGIEIRHIISHTSGVPGWEQPVTLADVCNFDKAVSLLAAQASWWTPGTASGYHSFTHGLLIGQVIRKVIGKTLKDFIQDEMAGLLGADFQLGVRDSDLHRVSDLIPWTPSPNADSPSDPNSISARVNNNPPFTPDMANTAMWRKAELGAANGHGNARSIAKILSAVSLGGWVDGKHLLKPETIDLIFQQMSNGTDLVTNMPVRFGIGYGIRGEGVIPTWLPEGRICFWSGLGGSVAIMDLDRKMTIVYAMNKLYPVGLGSNLTIEYVKEIYRAVGVSGL
ncbi:beta-lactamase/transpeptidase-like protein [Ilyonectria robusta]|uniref:beta-lactamase/transpeptidase-like protein n=1 Tax=Ilyonectria robusta TaxID=1079257 RepID=UPI001E8D6434|nr:beta-lactamase/transpeptidase-like protein [Ilyonectria robusta]KAH8661062.1 beta-lactamase/transpeptidase-like protein [Ilyonectria robusta]